MNKKDILGYFDYIANKADIARTHSPERDRVFNYYCKKLKRIIECYFGTQWIPFTAGDDGVLNCPMPDNGEEILVSDGHSVWIDKKIYDGNEYWLDYTNEPLFGLAWMPLPEPHDKEDKQ